MLGLRILSPRHSGWLCVLTTVGLASCGVPGIPKPPSLNLPQPATDLRAVRKGDRIFLSWSVPGRTTDSLPVKHSGQTQVCRGSSASMSECGTPIAQFATLPLATNGQAAKQTYIDTLLTSLLSADSSAQLFYAVAIQNQNGRSAGLSNIAAIPAVPAPPPPTDFRVQITADGVLATWSEPPPAARGRHFYRVYRRAEGQTADIIAGEADWGTKQLIDRSFEWEKTYFYRATVVTVIPHEGKSNTEFESDDTPAVEVFAHDVFPPAVPSGLQAVFSGAGQQPFIDLIWAPDTDADLAGYNVYRREEGGETRKINSSLVTAPAFRDTDVASGHAYVYSVSAIDVRGNESARSVEGGEAVP